MADKIDPETMEDIPEDELPEGDWEDLTPEVFKFERVGDTITGVYLGSSIQTVRGEQTSRHDMSDENGTPRFFWGSTVLDGRLTPVSVGDTIRIERVEDTEQEYQGGNAAKLYKVLRKRK